MTEEEGEKFLAQMDASLAGKDTAGATGDPEGAETARFGARLSRAIGGAPSDSAVRRLRERIAAEARPSRRPARLRLLAIGAAAAAILVIAVVAWRMEGPRDPRTAGGAERQDGRPQVLEMLGPLSKIPTPEVPKALAALPERIVVASPRDAGGAPSASPPMASRPFRSASGVLPALLRNCDLVVLGKVARVDAPDAGKRYGRFLLSVEEIWWSRLAAVKGGKPALKEIELSWDKGAPRVGAPPPGGWGPEPQPPRAGGSKVLLLKSLAETGDGKPGWSLLADLSDQELTGDDPEAVRRDFVREWCRLKSSPQGKERQSLLLEYIRAGAQKRGVAIAFALDDPKPADAASAREICECLMAETPQAGRGRSGHLGSAALLMGRCAQEDQVDRIGAMLADEKADASLRLSMCDALGESACPKAAGHLKAALDAAELELKRGREALANHVLSGLGRKPADAETLPRLAGLFRHEMTNVLGNRVLQRVLEKHGTASVPHVGGVLLAFDPKAFRGRYPNDQLGYMISIIADVKSRLGIPYLLVASLRPGLGDFSATCTHNGLTTLLARDIPAGDANVPLELRGEMREGMQMIGRMLGGKVQIDETPVPKGNAEEQLPSRMAAWARIGVPEQAGAIRALPERERRMIEAHFRRLWSEAASGSCRWIALRACALSLCAKPAGAWTAEDKAFARSLVADMERASATPPAEEIEKRLKALGAEDYPAREAASRSLEALGAGAAPLLKAALASKDPEIVERAAAAARRTRAQEIADELRCALSILTGKDPEKTSVADWRAWADKL